MNTIPKYQLTPAALTDRHQLMAVCIGCGHQAPFSVEGLDPYLELWRIERRLTCTQCGQRRINYFTVEFRD